MITLALPSVRSSCRSGFTFVELVIVLFIVAVITALTVPRIDVDGARVRASTAEVRSALIRSQRTAVMMQHDVVVLFSEDPAGVRIHLDANNDGGIQGDEVTQWHMLEPATAFGSVNVPALSWGSDAIGFDGATVTFHRDGSASRQGGIYLSSARQLQSGTYPEQSAAIEVVRSTGSIVCRTYRGGVWARDC